jgi:hypothetical protein
MAAASLTTLLSRLNVKSRDGSDITFTPGEKTEALTTAFADPFVVSIIRDTSLTTTTNTDNYTVPSTITTPVKVGLQLSSYGKPSDVDGWAVYGTKIYFDDLPPSGKTIVVIGTYKLTTDDSIPDNRQEYVLILAKIELVKYLQQSLANTFLTNDMTMGDLVQLETVLSREAEAWRSKFTNQVIEL